MNQQNSNKRVLILECTAKASLPIIESCTALGLNVVGGATQRYCCGLFSKYVKDRLIYPAPQQQPEACLESIENYLRGNDITMMFPVGDVMTDLIAKNQDLLRQHTNMILPGYDVFVHGRNKILTLKAAAKAGCPIPNTWYPDDEGLDRCIGLIADYPVLIKPAISAGARGIVICQNKEDVIKNYFTIKSQYGESFLQDYVPQNGMQFKVDAVMDAEQKLLAGVVYAKLRYYPPNGGSSVLNKTVHRPDILDAAVRVMQQLKWVGLCDFDFIEDPRDGVIKLMEINPRFPESFRATVAAGVDMTKILYQLAIGETPEKQLEYKSNQYNRFLFGDLMWFLKTKENRLKAEPSFFRFWSSDMYYQLIRKNDLGPIRGYILENMEMLWNKKLRQERIR